MIPAFGEIAAIRERLFDLSDEQFAKLVGFMERTRDLSTGRSVSNEALDAMRPRLRVSRPPRRLNVERIFCRPFEDVLHSGPDQSWRAGRIARAAIEPCWAVVSQRIAPSLLAEIRRDIGELTVADLNWPLRFGPPLWTAARAAFDAILGEADADRAAHAALVGSLGGAAGEASFRLMARMLAIAEIVEELRYILSPKPLAALDISHAAAVSGQFKALAAAKATLWEPLAYFVIARMAEPIALARAYGGAACADAGLHFLGVTASKVTIADLGATLGELDAVVAGTPDAAAAVASRGEIAADQIAKLREGVRERKFAASMAEIDRMQQGLRDAVSRNVLEGTGSLIAGSLETAAPADDAAGEAARDALRQTAEARAHALWKCARFAGKIGMDRELAQTVKSVEDEAGQLVLDQIAALQRGSGRPDDDAIDSVQASLVHAVRVVELVAGPERANALRKRGFEAIERLRAA